MNPEYRYRIINGIASLTRAHDKPLIKPITFQYCTMEEHFSFIPDLNNFSPRVKPSHWGLHRDWRNKAIELNPMTGNQPPYHARPSKPDPGTTSSDWKAGFPTSCTSSIILSTVWCKRQFSIWAHQLTHERRVCFFCTTYASLTIRRHARIYVFIV